MKVVNILFISSKIVFLKILAYSESKNIRNPPNNLKNLNILVMLKALAPG